VHSCPGLSMQSQASKQHKEEMYVCVGGGGGGGMGSFKKKDCPQTETGAW
jgi:hypothetical protein